jgi:hypothetical protein
MKDEQQKYLVREMPVSAKRPWETPALEVLPIGATQNNGLVAPGDGTFSPSPTGS